MESKYKLRNDILLLIKHIYNSNNQRYDLNIINDFIQDTDINDQIYLGRLLTEQYFNLSNNVSDIYFDIIKIIKNNILTTKQKYTERNISEFLDQIGRTYKYFPDTYKNDFLELIKKLFSKQVYVLNEVIVEFIEIIYFDLNKFNQKWSLQYLSNLKTQNISNNLKDSINSFEQKIIIK